MKNVAINPILFKMSGINSIGYYNLHETVLDLNFSDSWVIIFAEKGSFDLYANAKKYDVKENSGHIFFSDTLNIKTYDKTLKNSRIFIISFKVTGIDKNIDTKIDVRNWNKNEYLLSLTAKEIKKAYRLTPGQKITDFKLKSDVFLGAYQVISIYIEQYLISVFENKALKAQGGYQNKKNIEIVTEINNYLINNTDKKLTNYDISEKFNYSVSTLNKLFKECFGKTIHEHFLYLKIETAKKLLREQKISVYKISDILCFSDPQNFSRVFKKHTGITPNDYINKIKNDWR